MINSKMLSGEGDTYVYLGATKSGKTFLTREMIKKFGRNFDTITIMSGTSFSRDWEELGIVPVKVTIEKLEAFLAMAEEQIKVNGKPGRHLLVIDDAMSAVPSTRSKIFTTLATAGRHFGISTLLLVQHYKFITPTMRSNVTGWFVMGKQLPMVISSIYEVTPYNKGEFKKRYDKLEKFDFSYIDANAEVIFSRKVVKDGPTIFTQIPTDRERLRAALRAEAQVCERNPDRGTVYQEQPRRDEPMQAAPRVGGEQVYGAPIAAPYLPPNPFQQYQSSSSSDYAPVRTSGYIPTQPSAERSEREATPPPQYGGGGIFSGVFGTGNTDGNGGRSTPEPSVPPSAPYPTIRSAFL